MLAKKLEALFKPSAATAAHVIGELESDTMEVLWRSAGPLSVRQVSRLWA